jgi:hypothetical protein
MNLTVRRHHPVLLVQIEMHLLWCCTQYTQICVIEFIIIITVVL